MFDKARCKGAIIPTLDTPFLKDYRVFRDELQLLTEYFMAIEELDETCPYKHQIHTMEQLRDAYCEFRSFSHPFHPISLLHVT
jgi:hypothetical protein